MSAEFRYLLEQIAKQYGPVQVVPALVKSVDRDNWMVDVEPVDGSADILDVRLRSFASDNQNGFVLVPAVGSSVLVGFINNNQAAGYVCSWGEIDEVLLVMGDEVAVSIAKNGEVLMDIVKLGIDAGDVEVNGDVKFNNGTNGGLVKVNPLLIALNTLETKVLQIIVDLGLLAAPLGLTPSLTSVNAPVVTNTTLAQIENQEVKH